MAKVALMDAVRYTVSEVLDGKAVIQAEHKGQPIPAEIIRCEIHLTPVDPGQGSLTLRYDGAEAIKARSLLAPGTAVTLKIEVDGGTS